MVAVVADLLAPELSVLELLKPVWALLVLALDTALVLDHLVALDDLAGSVGSAAEEPTLLHLVMALRRQLGPLSLNHHMVGSKATHL